LLLLLLILLIEEPTHSLQLFNNLLSAVFVLAPSSCPSAGNVVTAPTKSGLIITLAAVFVDFDEILNWAFRTEI